MSLMPVPASLLRLESGFTSLDSAACSDELDVDSI